jgi:hypothetical protein
MLRKQMTTIQEINSAIIAGSFTNDELVSIGDAIRFARTQLTQQKKRSVTIGSTVKFTSAKRGVTVVGTVEKIAIKYITIRESNNGRLTTGLWKVPANMLEVV